MKHLFLLILTLTTVALACGPDFPASYLSHCDTRFSENINIPEELKLISREYDLLDYGSFPAGWNTTTIEAEESDFCSRATPADNEKFRKAYIAYAKAVRAGNTNTVAPELPAYLQEFTLYLEGIREFQNDPELTYPEAWKELLDLDHSNRVSRTVWTHYMLGNLASAHGRPEEASEQYAACRAEVETYKGDDQMGLAHASYKREYLAQTNLAARLERGIAAVGYYNQGWGQDIDRTLFCLEHLQVDMERARKEHFQPQNMAVLEAMTLFNVGDEPFIETMNGFPTLKITPRLAWFMYKSGRINTCRSYLARCPEEDILANWLRFRIAQRAGLTDDAIASLNTWIQQLSQTDRIVFDFGYRQTVSSSSVMHGNLGALHASKGQIMDAFLCFVNAGAYQDAALLAERYMETDELKRYIDHLDLQAPYHTLPEFDAPQNTENSPRTIQLRLSYLLARRLMREGRPEEALPYYPPELSALLRTYLNACRESQSIWNGRDTRSAHLYHAARIMRWKGMELCGTELYPDYTIVNGDYPYIAMGDESSLVPETVRPAYADTAPVPDTRFHYRQVASRLAGEAADLARSRHQKAMILWSAGMWIEKRHPREADVYYKKLARLHRQSLGKAADQKRWFPESTPMISYVHRCEDYLSPEEIRKASETYSK